MNEGELILVIYTFVFAPIISDVWIKIYLSFRNSFCCKSTVIKFYIWMDLFFYFIFHQNVSHHPPHQFCLCNFNFTQKAKLRCVQVYFLDKYKKKKKRKTQTGGSGVTLIRQHKKLWSISRGWQSTVIAEVITGLQLQNELSLTDNTQPSRYCAYKRKAFLKWERRLITCMKHKDTQATALPSTSERREATEKCHQETDWYQRWQHTHKGNNQSLPSAESKPFAT